jgi:uncharacterized protein YkwD
MKACRWICLILVLTSAVALACGGDSRVVPFDGAGESSREQVPASTDGNIPVSPDEDPDQAQGLSSSDSGVSGYQGVDDTFGEAATPQSEVAPLRALAVDLVNERRMGLGRSPLRVGDGLAAQLAAEESLANLAMLDYTQDGLPMEALYTATGGRGALVSSGQISGYFDAESLDQCRSVLVVCERTDAGGALATYIGTRLDAASAHDTVSLLFPDWEVLHVGVAYSEYTLVIVLQLEHQSVAYLEEPSVSDGLLSVDLLPFDGAGAIESIDIYHYPPPPSPESALVRTRVLSIFEPPGSGQIITLPDDRSITADHWSTEGGSTSIAASVAGRLPGPGLYGMVVWAGSEIPASQYFLILDEPTALRSDPSTTQDARDEVLTLEDLRAFALELINEDRRSHGAPPVRLGTNPAAQIHAEDSLRSGYLAGHWTSGGVKPYMLYTQTGGAGVMAENASGRTTGSENCDQPTVVCGEIDVLDSIETLQWSMVYDDAHANWGHRDVIIDPAYDTVNIGIAFSDDHVAFYQHFEYTRLAHVVPPSLEDGILELWFLPLTGLEIGHIFIYYDPPPTPKRPEEITRLTAYCVGGGFTDSCGNVEPAAQVYKPPPAGSYYADLEPEDVVARAWNVYEDGRVGIEADLRHLVAAPGVYTIVIVSDNGKPEQLSMYSVVR